jgi:glycosyltransferase involved in cell wall biosynthesis
MMSSTQRVVLQQPALAAYRIAPFKALAARPGIDLTVVYGSRPHSPPNVAPEGFEGKPWQQRAITLIGQYLFWHQAQWHYAHPKRADVLILSWNVRYLSLLRALLRARWHKLLVILWGHGYSKRERGWRAWLRDRIARLAGALLLYNHTAAQRCIDAGWPRERVFVALNSLDQAPIQQARDAWQRDPAALEQFREEHGLNPGPVLLFVSRLPPENRLDLLLHAVASLKNDYPDLKVVAISKGQAEMQRLRQLAKTLGIDDRLIMPGAIYEEPKLAPWFLSAAVFCYPEKLGLSLLHAFGYGLPVITGERIEAQNPEIEALEPGVNGLTYPADDATALAQHLRELLRAPERRQRISRPPWERSTTRLPYRRWPTALRQRFAGWPYTDQASRRAIRTNAACPRLNKIVIQSQPRSHHG